jgi:S-(hydroxymethyl)glutathione dehydrogenase/alcohol dehydrogenase
VASVRLRAGSPVLDEAPGVPGTPGDGEVALRTTHVLVDEADRRDRATDRWAGAGCVGEVTATGPGVDDGLVGTAVLVTGPAPCRRCTTCRRGQGHLCLVPRRDGPGTRGVGGARDRLVVAADRVTPIPTGTSPAAAALLGGAGLAGAAAVRGAARLVPGERIALVGDVAALVGVAVAAAAGARTVVAAPLTPEDDEVASALGADVVARPAALADAVAGATDGDGVDACIVLGAPAELVTPALDATRPGGTLVLVPSRLPATGPGSTTLVPVGDGRTVVDAPFGGADAERDLPWLVPLLLERDLRLDRLVTTGDDGLAGVLAAVSRGDAAAVRTLHAVG